MSESTPLAADVIDGETGRRRLLLVAGGLVTTVALALGGFLLLGGGEDDVPLGVAPVLPVAAAAPTAPPTAAALPVPFEEDLGRNPFKALYVVPAVAAGDAGTGGGVLSAPVLPGAPVSSATTPPSTGPVGGPAPVPPATGPYGDPAVRPYGGPAAAPVGGPVAPAGAPVAPAAPTDREYALVLRSVAGEGVAQRARFTIDGAPVEVAVGERFGATDEIRLLSLQEGPAEGQWTAVLQVGDGEPFDAVTGEAVSVR